MNDQGALSVLLDVSVVGVLSLSHGGQTEHGQSEDTGCGSSPTPQRTGVVLHGLGFLSLCAAGRCERVTEVWIGSASPVDDSVLLDGVTGASDLSCTGRRTNQSRLR